MTAWHIGTKILKFSKFWSRHNVVSRSWTMRELFVNSSWICRDNAGGCVPVRVRQRLSRNSTNSSRTTHVEFTSSSYMIHDRVANFCTTHTATCTSRIAGASSSWLVYALLEQFAHGTTSSQIICDEFTCSSRLLRDSGARVVAGAYIGVLSFHCMQYRHVLAFLSFTVPFEGRKTRFYTIPTGNRM